MGYTFDAAKYFLRDPKRAVAKFREMEAEAGCYREIFVDQVYYWLYKRIKPDTTVLDIGAFMGDTAIYFAMNPNTIKVISYEPNPHSISEFRRYTARCPPPQKDKIALVKSGIYTTHELNKELRRFNKIALKVDVDGLEHGLEHGLFANELDLKNVYAIEMEYHDNKGTLKKVLQSKGFKVEMSPLMSNPERKMGLLKGWK